MEAPEKIYLQHNTTTDLYGVLWPEWFEERAKDDDVEYTRTDAFIDKACDAYCKLCDTKECGDTGECEWVEKFRKRLMR